MRVCSSSLSWASTLFSGPQRNHTMPSGDSWPGGRGGCQGCSLAAGLGKVHRGPKFPSVLTPLHIDAAGLILVDEALHLVRTRWWEQQGIEPGVALFLVDEFGQVLLSHIGFGLGVAAGQREEHGSPSRSPGLG